MFRTFAKFTHERPEARDLVQFHPSDLTAVLELAWDRRADRTNLELGHPFHRSDLFNFSYDLVWKSGSCWGRPDRAFHRFASVSLI